MENEVKFGTKNNVKFLYKTDPDPVIFPSFLILLYWFFRRFLMKP